MNLYGMIDIAAREDTRPPIIATRGGRLSPAADIIAMRGGRLSPAAIANC